MKKGILRLWMPGLSRFFLNTRIDPVGWAAVRGACKKMAFVAMCSECINELQEERLLEHWSVL
jgi:hypothetical protein